MFSKKPNDSYQVHLTQKKNERKEKWSEVKKERKEREKIA